MASTRTVFFCLTLVWVSTSLAQPETPPVTLNFGVVPQQAVSRVAQLWVPLLRYLSEKTGYAIDLRTAPDIPEFERRMAAGEYDLAYMNPFHYTVFHVEPGYTAFAKQKDSMIVGILVVRADSPLTDIAQLANQTLAFPAPAAFGASVLPRASLRQRGIPFSSHFVMSHDSVYQAVSKGLYPAGGGIETTLATTRAPVREQLRVLWRTPGYTPHAIAAHPRLSSDIVAQVAQAMYAMDGDAAGKIVLAPLGFAGIAPARDADWNDIRALHIEELTTD